MTAGDIHRTTGSHTEADLNVLYEYERRSSRRSSDFSAHTPNNSKRAAAPGHILPVKVV